MSKKLKQLTLEERRAQAIEVFTECLREGLGFSVRVTADKVYYFSKYDADMCKINFPDLFEIGIDGRGEKIAESTISLER